MSSELVDRLALTDLVAQYAIAVDHRDEPALTVLFADDAELVQPAGLVRRGWNATLTGNVGIAAGVLEAVAHLHSTRHVVSQQIVDLSGDTARGQVYGEAHHVYATGGGHRDYVVAMRYQDEYRRADGAWRISRRELSVDFTYDVEVELLQ